MDSPNLAIVFFFAFLLGLRHATDPDHLVALSTLVAGTKERAGRAAARLGGRWGVGHALALVVFGLPLVLLHALLRGVTQGAGGSAAVGILRLARTPSQGVAAVAFCIFAAGTAVSMALL